MEDLEEKWGEIEGKFSELKKGLKLDSKKEEIERLEKEISSPSFWQKASSNRTVKELKEKKGEIEGLEEIFQKREELKTFLELLKVEKDEKLREEAEELADFLKGKISEISLKSLFSKKEDKNSAILTLHSGAGGTEACDWVDMLLRMYSKWSESRGLGFKIVDLMPGEEAGIKRATAIIEGQYSYGYLKGENGVHRLVRISPFDSNKRRHTSFASVSIIPDIPKEIKVEIKENELKIDTFRAGGHGGQNVNKLETAVRITHLPTKITVSCQNERSQFKNKELGLKILRAKLYQHYQEREMKKEEERRVSEKDIAWGSQIRSYIFQPYQLVKDHRTGVEITDVQKVMDGKIDAFLEAELKQ